MQAALGNLKNHLVSVDAANLREHAARAADNARIEEAVIALFQSRLESGATAAHVRPPPAPPPENFVDTEAVRALKEQLAKAQAHVLALESEAAQAMSVDQADTRWNLSVAEASAQNLPDIELAAEDPKRDPLSKLHCLLTLWFNAGAAVPFTFKDLEAHGMPEPQQVVKFMSGDLWSNWFAEGAVPAEDTLPRQAVLFLYNGLEKLTAHCNAQQETKEAAASCYAVLAERHGSKKRRAC